MPIYRKPHNWITRIHIRRSNEAFEHQTAIQELGFEKYVSEGLVMLSVDELQHRLHPGTRIIYGLVRRPPMKDPSTFALILERTP